MTRHAVVSRLVVCFAFLLAAGQAQAGQTCDEKPMTVVDVTRGMALAQQTAQALEEEHQRSGAQVVLLARAGQDLSRYHLRYSHFGWAYRTPEGQWRVLHKLNDCGTAKGDLYRQGLGQFFLDRLWRYEAVWAVPGTDWQEALYRVINDPSQVAQMQHRPYSLVSYAWATRYQQSNQWALETLALAAEPGVRTREQAQAWLRLKDYRPTRLHIGALTRLGARVGRANVAFDDHPNELRFSDRIDTVTVDSVLDWMQRLGQVGAPRRLTLCEEGASCATKEGRP
jgi:hypothetical protein